MEQLVKSNLRAWMRQDWWRFEELGLDCAMTENCGECAPRGGDLHTLNFYSRYHLSLILDITLIHTATLWLTLGTCQSPRLDNSVSYVAFPKCRCTNSTHYYRIKGMPKMLKTQIPSQYSRNFQTPSGGLPLFYLIHSSTSRCQTD